MRLLRGSLNQQSAVSRMLTVGSGGAIAQGINGLAILVLARLYTPESYATWALLMSVVAIAASVASLRYELAIVLAASYQEAVSLLWACGIIAVATGGLCTVAVGLWGPNLLGTGTYISLRSWLYSIPILVGGAGVYQACCSWFTRMQSFSSLAAASISLAAFTVFSQIAAAFLGFSDSSGLIYGSIVGTLASIVVLIAMIARKQGRSLTSSISLPVATNALTKYKNFPLYMTPYALVGVIRERIALFLLSSFGARADVGYYALSMRIVNLPINLASSGIRPVLFQKAAVTDLSVVERFVVKLLQLIMKCTTPVVVFFVFYASDIFTLVFGKEWADASLYAVFLAIPGFALLHTNWMDRILDVLGRQRLAFAMETVFSILSVGGFVIGLVVYSSVIYALAFQAAILLVYNVVWVCLVFQVADFDLTQLVRLGRDLIVLALACAAILWGLHRLFGAHWAALVYGGAVAGYVIRSLNVEGRTLEDETSLAS